jgi:hypothetical protein
MFRSQLRNCDVFVQSEMLHYDWHDLLALFCSRIIIIHAHLFILRILTSKIAKRSSLDIGMFWWENVLIQ